LRDRELDPGSVGLVREISGGSWSSPAESDLRPVRSIDVVARHNHIAVFSKTEKHYLMLRDSRADQVLPARNPGLQVENLRTIPSRKFVTRANIVSHKSSFSLWIPPTEMK